MPNFPDEEQQARVQTIPAVHHAHSYTHVRNDTIPIEAKLGGFGASFNAHKGTVALIGAGLFMLSVAINLATVPRLFNNQSEAIQSVQLKLVEIQKDLKSLEVRLAELQSQYVTRAELRQISYEMAESISTKQAKQHVEMYHRKSTAQAE